MVLPNLIEAGDIGQAVCDEIWQAGYSTRGQEFFGPKRMELFEEISGRMNEVMACRTVHGGLESLLGPGYFMPPWNTHLHVNGVGDEYVPGNTGFHADGTDHGPTQSTVRDHRPRQIFGFFYPGDVPDTHGPTAVMPSSQYKAVDRVRVNGLHEVNSEDELTIAELPPQLLPSWDEEAGSEAEFAAADEHRMRVASHALGEPRDDIEELKLTCKAGTVVLVHYDVFHRSSRRLPDVWRPLFVLRDCARMTEPVAGSPSWATDSQQWQQPQSPTEALHQTFWRYLLAEEDRAPALTAASLGALVRTVTNHRADIDRVAAAYAIGRTQDEAAIRALIDLLSHEQEAARRAAGYGLTVGGPAAVEALLPLLSEPPTVPTRLLPANIDEQGALLPRLVHGIAQLAEHACSLTVVDALVECSNRAKTEIKEYEKQDTRAAASEDPNEYVYYVIERRRAMVECCFALGHIGQIAARENNVVVCSAACTHLISVVCDGEPGRQYVSFMTVLRVTHSAITNLIRLASTPASAAATPLNWGGSPNNLVPEAWSAGEQSEALTGQPPGWAVDGPTACSMRSMMGEAAWRLRASCASDESNDAWREALRLVEAEDRWPGFSLPAPGEPSAFMHHAPLLAE